MQESVGDSSYSRNVSIWLKAIRGDETLDLLQACSYKLPGPGWYVTSCSCKLPGPGWYVATQKKGRERYRQLRTECYFVVIWTSHGLFWQQSRIWGTFVSDRRCYHASLLVSQTNLVYTFVPSMLLTFCNVKIALKNCLSSRIADYLIFYFFLGPLLVGYNIKLIVPN